MNEGLIFFSLIVGSIIGLRVLAYFLNRHG